MNTANKLIPLGLLLALQLPSSAGEPVAEATPAAASNPGDWCDWLKSKPTQFKFDNPFIQSVYIGGRFQYQAAYIDGEDVNGNEFDDTYDEYRRARIETKTDFLNYFSLKANINIVDDQRFNGADLDWQYVDFDELLLTFDIKKAFGAGSLDTLKVNYGRMKFIMTEEVRTSSKEIITIERSAISNKVYNSARPTGFTVDLAQGPWSGTAGIFSAEGDSDTISPWSGGVSYYLAGGYKATDELRFSADFVKNDPTATDDRLGYDWATSFNAVYEQDRFGVLGTVVVGENLDGTGTQSGSFHGAVAMPWYWIMEDRLQVVAQYSYAGSDESEGIRTNGRYVRALHDDETIDVNSGRGDELHTFYAGLNYYLCGHNAKIMGGVEYASLNTPDGDVDALTYLIAFRTFF